MTRHWPHSPGDTIKSAEDNDDKDGLAAGSNDYDNNSIFVFRKEAFESFFVRGKAIWSTSSGLTGSMTAGNIYASSNGDRIAIAGIGSKAFSANQDAYVIFNEQTGAVRYNQVSVGATPGALSANEVVNAVVTTGASTIIRILQSGSDSLGRYIYNTAPVGKKTVASDVQGYVGESRVWRGTLTNIPSNWLPEDGRALSRATYASLYAVIGTQWGAGDGSTTFNLPNTLGRVDVGIDSTQSEFTPLGKSAGDKAVILDASQNGTHSHGVYDGGHAHSFNIPTYVANGGGGLNYAGGGSVWHYQDGPYGTSGSGANIGIYNSGDSAPHTNLQPYNVTVKMIRVL